MSAQQGKGVQGTDLGVQAHGAGSSLSVCSREAIVYHPIGGSLISQSDAID